MVDEYFLENTFWIIIDIKLMPVPYNFNINLPMSNLMVSKNVQPPIVVQW